MRHFRIDNRGFSLTELMFAMTIMAVGLLALAQMQMMAMRGTSSAREFSVATKIAREGMERLKVPGMFQLEGTVNIQIAETIMDHDDQHNDEASMAPEINTGTDPAALRYDLIEVFMEDPGNPMSLVSPICGPNKYPNNACDATIANEEAWDFVRITNIRNWPLGSPDRESVLKEISVTVLWKERGLTRSVNVRTLIGRKDNAFY